MKRYGCDQEDRKGSDGRWHSHQKDHPSNFCAPSNRRDGVGNLAVLSECRQADVRDGQIIDGPVNEQGSSRRAVS
jgi:hypothetical protein